VIEHAAHDSIEAFFDRRGQLLERKRSSNRILVTS